MNLRSALNRMLSTEKKGFFHFFQSLKRLWEPDLRDVRTKQNWPTPHIESNALVSRYRNQIVAALNSFFRLKSNCLSSRLQGSFHSFRENQTLNKLTISLHEWLGKKLPRPIISIITQFLAVFRKMEIRYCNILGIAPGQRRCIYTAHPSLNV